MQVQCVGYCPRAESKSADPVKGSERRVRLDVPPVVPHLSIKMSFLNVTGGGQILSPYFCFFLRLQISIKFSLTFLYDFLMPHV